MILVSVDDAAKWTNIPTGTIRRWVANGWLLKFHDRPCVVDALQVERVRNQIGSGRNRARKTRP